MEIYRRARERLGDVPDCRRRCYLYSNITSHLYFHNFWDLAREYSRNPFPPLVNCPRWGNELQFYEVPEKSSEHERGKPKGEGGSYAKSILPADGIEYDPGRGPETGKSPGPGSGSSRHASGTCPTAEKSRRARAGGRGPKSSARGARRAPSRFWPARSTTPATRSAAKSSSRWTGSATRPPSPR